MKPSLEGGGMLWKQGERDVRQRCKDKLKVCKRENIDERCKWVREGTVLG